MKLGTRDNSNVALLAWQRTDVRSAAPRTLHRASGIGGNHESSITDTFTDKPFRRRARMAVRVRNRFSSWTPTPAVMTRPSCTGPLQLVLDLAQEALDTVTLFLLTPFGLVMLVAHKSSHRCGQRAHTITHPRAFRSEDDALHPCLSVVPAIIRTVGGMVAGGSI